MQKILSSVLALNLIISVVGFLAITTSATAACYVDEEGVSLLCTTPATSKPKNGINVFSFALNPELHQPSGTTNLAKPELEEPKPSK